MIIWINGAFGSGKTNTAFELHRRIPNSYVYDPENVGYFIDKNIPIEIQKNDFQNYRMWREFNYSMLKYLDQEYSGIIIVPMTLVEPTYFHEIVGKLRGDGIQINYFTLCATKEVLLNRLKSRLDDQNSWAAQQIDRCISGLSNEIHENKIDTNHILIEEVAEQIADLCSISLLISPRKIN